MKKVKQIDACYCDYCGKECEHTNFIVPSLERIYATSKSGVKLIDSGCKEVKPVEKDICKECQVKISYFIPLIRNMQIDEYGNFSLIID